MEHPGRKSAADLSVVRLTASDRPQPPDHMSPWQADLWRSVTATKPADWFTDDTLPLLEAYVEAAQSHRTVSELLNAYSSEMLRDDATLAMYDKASKIQTRSAGTLAQMAIKMRLSQSARYGARGASGAHERTSKAAKPWET
jgi:hypothetical protein